MIPFRPLLLTGLLALSGCQEKRSDEPSATSVNLFQKGKGVWLPEQMQTEFGVQIEDVAERRISRTVRRTAQVFRISGNDSVGEAIVSLVPAEARELRPGQRVTLKLREAPAFDGLLKTLDNQMQPVSGQLEAIIEFSRENPRIEIGSFLEAQFVVGEPIAFLAVPESAILTTALGTYVYARNGEHLTRTLVKTGARQDGFVAIEEGLYAGDAVAVKGVENVWLVELSALKGGKPCCAVPKKGGKT
jgi:hypothetical protein